MFVIHAASVELGIWSRQEGVLERFRRVQDLETVCNLDLRVRGVAS